ncbi:MAG: acyl-CoA dehydrogenase family protein [Bacteroidota bacterium]
MEFKLSKEQKKFKREVTSFATKQLKDESLQERESGRAFSRDLWDKCGEEGIQGLHVPEAYGGKGCDTVELALAMEAMGNGCDDAGLLVSLSAQMLRCQVPLMQFGTDAQKEKYLPGLAKGSMVATCAMHEVEADADYDNLTTTAVADGDGFILTGKKAGLINAPIADVALVYAVTDAEKGIDGGITCFLLDTSLAGVTRTADEDAMAYRTASVGGLQMENVQVSADAVLGEVGAGAAVYNAGVKWERSLLSAMHVGRMDYLLEKAIMFARTRKSQGQPVGKKQSVSHRITDMKMRLEVGRLLSYKAAWSLEHNPSDTQAASISKLFASESMVQSTIDAGQIFGGEGFVASEQTGRSLHDAFGSTLYAGTAAMQRNTIARSLGLV